MQKNGLQMSCRKLSSQHINNRFPKGSPVALHFQKQLIFSGMHSTMLSETFLMKRF